MCYTGRCKYENKWSGDCIGDIPDHECIESLDDCPKCGDNNWRVEGDDFICECDHKLGSEVEEDYSGFDDAFDRVISLNECIPLD